MVPGVKMHVSGSDADVRRDSYMNITRIKISPNTTFSRSYPSCTSLPCMFLTHPPFIIFIIHIE